MFLLRILPPSSRLAFASASPFGAPPRGTALLVTTTSTTCSTVATEVALGAPAAACCISAVVGQFSSFNCRSSSPRSLLLLRLLFD